MSQLGAISFSVLIIIVRNVSAVTSSRFVFEDIPVDTPLGRTEWISIILVKERNIGDETQDTPLCCSRLRRLASLRMPQPFLKTVVIWEKESVKWLLEFSHELSSFKLDSFLWHKKNGAFVYIDWHMCRKYYIGSSSILD